MEFWLSGQARLGYTLIALVALWTVESVAPLFPLRANRIRHALPNLGLMILATALYLAFFGLSAGTAAWCLSHRIGLSFLADFPAWMALLVGVLGLDLFAHIAHVAMHYVPLGWRLHRIHHSDSYVDVTTAFRQHPGETLIRIAFQVAAIAVFGIPLWVIVIYLAASALNAQLEHANLKFPEKLDRVLRWVFVTPNMHKAHHSRDKRETNSNYSNIFSIWDRVFGTYTVSVNFECLSYGLDGDDAEDQTLAGLLRAPFAQIHKADADPRPNSTPGNSGLKDSSEPKYFTDGSAESSEKSVYEQTARSARV